MNGGQDDGGWYHDDANEVHVTRIDVPFLDLTWFFVKASLALAVAFSLTSWLWVMIGTGMLAVSASMLLVLGVPAWFSGSAPAPRAQVAPAIPPPVLVAPATASPPAEVPAPEEAPVDEEPEEPLEEPEPPVPTDPNQAATEAALRAELERIRRERNR